MSISERIYEADTAVGVYISLLPIERKFSVYGFSRFLPSAAVATYLLRGKRGIGFLSRIPRMNLDDFDGKRVPRVISNSSGNRRQTARERFPRCILPGKLGKLCLAKNHSDPALPEITATWTISEIPRGRIKMAASSQVSFQFSRSVD